VHVRTDTERSLMYASVSVTLALPTTAVAVMPLPPLVSLRSGETAAALFLMGAVGGILYARRRENRKLLP